jgi:serine/threonine-protein phosphatase 2B catalytic subunit
LDLANERLPDFENRPTIFPVPSMRATSRRDSDGMDMEYLIKRTLDEEGDEGDVVEKLAEKIARGRSITAKPSLKRHDTA